MPSEAAIPQRPDRDFISRTYGVGKKFYEDQFFNELQWRVERDRIQKSCPRNPLPKEILNKINTLIQSYSNKSENRAALYTQKIVELLEQHRPVGVSYNINGIAKWNKKHPGHLGIVVGYHRTADGRVYFKLRHSFGVDCKTIGIPNCRGGYQTVSASDMSAALDGLVWMAERVDGSH